MGACASVPKSLKAKFAAPAPEPAKEETPAVEVAAKDEVVEVTDKDVSLGALLVEGEAPKETEAPKEVVAEVKAEEKAEVSEPAAVTEEAPKEEEKKPEATETK